MDPLHVVAKRKRVKIRYPDHDTLKEFTHGSTYVGLEDTIAMQKKLVTIN